MKDGLWRSMPSLGVALILLALTAHSASAVRVVWETGALIGTYHGGPSPACLGYVGVSEGTFEFEDGEESVAGVDYSDANPGTFEVCVLGAETGTWRGEFSATNVVFGTTEGVYSRPSGPVAVGMTLALEGPLTFDPQPPLEPLPEELSDLRFQATMTVTEVRPGGEHDFLGSFVLTAEVPAVCGDGLVTGDESCDDGNTEAGDCCDPSCTPEPYAQACDVGPTGICDGLGSCVDPEQIPPLLYFSHTADVDVGVYGLRRAPDSQTPLPNGTPSVALALDPLDGDLYGGSFGREIWRMPLDGAPSQVFRDLGPGSPWPDVAVDPVRRQLYWTEADRHAIGRASLAQPTDADPDFLVLTAQGARPVRVEVDAAGARLYWLDSVAGRIQRADLDGGGIETLPAPAAVDLAIDSVHEKLYFAAPTGQPGGFLVRRSALDGSAVETLAGTDSDPVALYGLAVDPDAEVLYLAESVRLRRLDLVTGEIEVLSSIFGSYNDVVVDPTFVTVALLPAGAPAMRALLGGPARTGGVAVAFERSEGGQVAAEYEVVPLRRLRAETGIDPGRVRSVLGSDPVQLWRLYARGRFGGEVAVEVGYDEALLPRGLAETDLSLSTRAGDQLVVLPSQVDPEANRIRATSSTARGGLLGTRRPGVASREAVLLLTARKWPPWWRRLWPW